MQNYKVFVENHSISFVQTSEVVNKKNWFLFESVKKARKIVSNQNNSNVVFTSDSAKEDFQKYFKKYKKITASGGLVMKGEKFLVIKRNGIWDLPKGKVEKGESIPLAGIREIEEETGIQNPKIITKLFQTYHTYNFKGKDVLKDTHWYLMKYDGNDQLLAQDEEGIEKVKWISQKKLIKMKNKTYFSIREVIETFEKL